MREKKRSLAETQRRKEGLTTEKRRHREASPIALVSNPVARRGRKPTHSDSEQEEDARTVLSASLRLCERVPALLCFVVSSVLLSGCTGPNLNAARENFYLGRLDRAEASLSTLPEAHTDRGLFLMERGMVRQLQGSYTNSAQDWLDALDAIEELDTYSLTRGIASLAINDSVQGFRGWPYERTLIHAFAAKSYIALGLWDDAAVEARRLVARRENESLRGFPEDPYSVYLSAVCFQMIGDDQGAAFEYRMADRLMPDMEIDAHTGRFSAPGAAAPRAANAGEAELICFVGLGRSPRYASKRGDSRGGTFEPYVELYAGGTRLGRSYTFASTPQLMAETEKQLALLTIAKTAGRIALKEMAAEAVERKDKFLGELTRLVLFAAEAPNNRRWETLPRYLQVARVKCPKELRAYDVVFRAHTGAALERQTVTAPLIRRGNTLVSFCRDIEVRNAVDGEARLPIHP